MKIIQAVEFDSEELAVLEKVMPLLELGPKIIDDRQAMRSPRTLRRIGHAIQTAITEQRRNQELWITSGAELEQRNAAIFTPGAADQMIRLTSNNLLSLAAAASIINQAINLTTPEDPDTA